MSEIGRRGVLTGGIVLAAAAARSAGAAPARAARTRSAAPAAAAQAEGAAHAFFDDVVRAEAGTGPAGRF